MLRQLRELFTYKQRNKRKRKKETENVYSYMAGSRQHLTCSFMPTCLRCHALVDTIVLLTVCTLLLCAGPIEGCSAALAVRTVDAAAVAFGACLCCAYERRKASSKTKTSWLFRAADDTASSLQEAHLPSSHVHLAVGTPQCHDLD